MKKGLDQPIKKFFSRKQLLGIILLAMGLGMLLMFLFQDWIIMLLGLVILAVMVRGFRKAFPDLDLPVFQNQNSIYKGKDGK